MVVRENPQHVAVIGAGIVGATIAWRIASRGLRVTLIDKSEPGSGASSHSFAWINAGAKEPIGYHNLNRRSLEMWTRFSAALGDEVGLRWGGKVSWETDSAAAEQLKARVSQLQSWGYPSRLVSAPELSELEPALEIGPVLAAEYSENEGQAEPQMVVDACLRRLHKLEASVLTGVDVVDFDRNSSGQIRAIQTAHHEIQADTVVLAAGTDTTGLAARAGVKVPQAQSPGVVLRTTPLPRLLEHIPVVYAPPLGDGRREIHLRQCADGSFMIGEGDQESLAEDDSQEHANELLARAACYLPGLSEAEAIPVPVGWRPMPVDGYPTMGFTAKSPNLYVALTHSGVTLAPVLSQLAALEICENVRADAVLEPYRPERFASLTEEQIEQMAHPRAGHR